MKALTVKPPWSGLIIHGGKNIENREWPTKLRGRIAIHASAKGDHRDLQPALEVYETCRGQGLEGVEEYRWWSGTVCQAGAILGTVEIVDCVRKHESPWFFGTWGFVLANPRPLAVPIPIRGQLGLWEVPEDIAAKVIAEVGE